MLKQIQEAMVDRLAPLEAEGWRLGKFPGKGAELGRAFPKGRVLVGLNRETLEAPQRLNPDAPMIQPRMLRFEVVLEYSDRDEEGLLDTIDRIRDLLTGFVPEVPRAKAFYETEAGFVDKTENGLWVYSMSFSLYCPYIKQPEQ